MINNFDLIENLLKFDSGDDFYHLQILKRKKDNPGLAGRNNNARCVKTYFIPSVEYLKEKKEEIIQMCMIHNARACINLNRRSFEKIAFQTLRKITDQIMSKDFKSAKRAYESVCGAYSNEPYKKWIIDFDTKDTHFLPRLINELSEIAPIGNKIYERIPTKNGYHLIVAPFNTENFTDLLDNWTITPYPDIHKDNPTILFIP